MKHLSGQIRITAKFVNFAVCMMLGILLGYAIAYRQYVILPFREESIRLEACATGEGIDIKEAGDILTGSDLQRFLISNQDFISRQTGDVFFVNGDYRSSSYINQSYGLYFTNASTICIFDSKKSIHPEFRFIEKRGDGYYYVTIRENKVVSIIKLALN